MNDRLNEIPSWAREDDDVGGGGGGGGWENEDDGWNKPAPPPPAKKDKKKKRGGGGDIEEGGEADAAQPEHMEKFFRVVEVIKADIASKQVQRTRFEDQTYK